MCVTLFSPFFKVVQDKAHFRFKALKKVAVFIYEVEWAFGSCGWTCASANICAKNKAWLMAVVLD